MKGLRFKVLCLCLITVMLFSSGCASAQKKKRIDDLETQVSQLTQSMRGKDAELVKCQESLENIKMQLLTLEELQNELDKCREELKACKEGQDLK